MVARRPASVFDTAVKERPGPPVGPYQVRCVCGWSSELHAEYEAADAEMCVHNRSHWVESQKTWVVEPQLPVSD